MQKHYLTCIMKLPNAKYYTVLKWPQYYTTTQIKHELLKYEKAPSKILFHDIATVYTIEKIVEKEHFEQQKITTA